MSGLPAGHDTQAAFAAVLVDEWLRAGLSDAVVAPGSRSTPLLVALAERAERGHLRLHVVLDERSAGFLALGLGRASGRPALVVTTSGTAAAELHPAVQEADQGGVPMVAVTADRPPELHDCGAPQTAPQVGLFGGAPRWQLSPGPPDLAAASAWRPMASRAVAEALGGLRPPGPVHLNLAFREPLLGSAGAVLEAGPGGPVHAAVAHGRADGAAWHRVPPPAPVVPPADVIELLSRASRGLIVAGWGVGDPSAVWSLAEASGWPVLAEPISGCRQPGAIGTADALLRTELVRGWEPDVVLRLGAPWLSRALNEWLAGLTCPQILADPWGRWAAPDRQPSVVVQASPDDVCRAVATAVPASGRGPRTGWSERWSMAEQLAQEAIGAALAREAELNEPALVRELVSRVPEGSTLVVSSSMPARDVEWWPRPRKGLRFIANRGVNGIDGVVSTALGVALAGSRRTVALVGDLAFAYDVTALLPARELGAGLDIVVVDNDGGGIFNFLPQAAQQPPERFERLWATPHRVDLVQVARCFGADAAEVDDLQALAQRLGDEHRGGVRAHVAKIRRQGNVAVHQRLHAAVAEALEALA